MKRYALAVYRPNSGYDPLVTLESDSPFQGINVGDFLDPRVWPIEGEGDLVTKLLRVVSIKHCIFQSQDPAIGVRHHVSVFTDQLPNLEDTVLPK